ncbi:MAG: hypothetical protein GXY94_04810 [Bacteroidales bacterium]|nr:hypothetical protein [Bacteroidales bacterium]HBG86796.1 hypothetical protein [Marinilabiliaceae bacterium]HBX88204.1 hypothetical protein [Marinilabiliaceae bacterium]
MEAIVTVDGVSLTLGELNRAVPDNLAAQDSIAIAEDYISRWVRTKLMLRQAEINLSAEEKDVEQLLEEYRTSLLVHLYQQKMLEQKHSPLVTSREIEEYYTQMQDNFNLQESIIKGIFIRIPKDAPNQDLLRKWINSADLENLVNIEAYAFRNARTYEQFVETWVPFSRINSLLPEAVGNEERFLRWNTFYETSDGTYNYFLSITDYKLPGSSAPIKYVEERIKAILLNKKRIEFIQQLGADLYDEAIKEKIVSFK